MDLIHLTYPIALAAAVAVFVYLVTVLFLPERFS